MSNTSNNFEAQRLQTILDNVLDGIITINEQGQIDSFNRAAQKIFGYAEQEVLGHNIKLLMPEPYRSQHDQYLQHYKQTGHRKIIGIGREVIGLRKDGSTFPMELAVSEMWLGEQRLFSGIVRDITERKQHEKLKSEFISTVSHELRTPLTSIHGAIGLVNGSMGDSLPEKARQMLNIAERNSQRLIMLVNDILDIEKIESGSMTFYWAQVSVAALLEQAITINQPYAEQQQVSFQLQLDPALRQAYIHVDENRMMQVLNNLLSNAAKYAPSGTIVTVSPEIIQQKVRINISDCGPGISDAFKQRIFQKFAQSDASDTRQKGGTGLGLSISKAIIEKMHGTIGFSSEPDVKTTFYVTLPLMPDDTGTDTADNDQSLHLLIYDGKNNSTRRLAKDLLDQQMLVELADHPARITQLLGERTFNALIINVETPDQEIIQLIQSIRQNSALETLPILVVATHLTTDNSEQLTGEAFQLVNWIQMPADQHQLPQILTQAIEQLDHPRSRILHIEDDFSIYSILKVLVGEFATVENVTTLSQASALLQQKHYDLIILDLGLPDGNGLELLPIAAELNQTTPVIIFSAQESLQTQFDQIQAIQIKSRTSNTQLVSTIRKFLKHN